MKIRLPIFKLLGLSCLAYATLLRADSLSVGSANAAAGTVISLPFSFTNTNQIVGIQFDLAFPTTLVESGSAVSSASGFTVESREIAVGQRRVVVFSPTNELLPDDAITSIPLTLLPASPSGGPTVTVRNIILTNRQGQTFTPTLNYPALDAWRQQYFTEAERTDAALIGDDKDADGDGIPNLLEFLQGSNPRTKEPDKAPKATVATATAGGPALKLTFRTAKNVTAAQLTVQGSNNLQSWTGNGITLTPTGTEDATTMEFEATLPVAAEAKQFLRLVGTRTAGN
jgi:hypothetical protein